MTAGAMARICAASIAIGIAAVQSIRDNRPVDIAEIAPLQPMATRLSELV